MTIEYVLERAGVDYTIKRTGMPDRCLKGLFSNEQKTGKAYIGFVPGADIITGDILTNPSGDTYLVVETRTKYVMQEPHQLTAYVQTEQERNASNLSAHSVFNIQNAYGSVIGNQENATIHYSTSLDELKDRVSAETSPDKEDMEKIVTLLEMIVHNQVPPSKGLFSKFSSIMERHSWLSSSVASTVLAWLMSQIH